jgi:hypothetical protein
VLLPFLSLSRHPCITAERRLRPEPAIYMATRISTDAKPRPCSPAVRPRARTPTPLMLRIDMRAALERHTLPCRMLAPDNIAQLLHTQAATTWCRDSKVHIQKLHTTQKLNAIKNKRKFM